MENRKNNISDEQLDELFKRSAEELDVEFEAASWQKLSQRLDAAGVPSSNGLTWKRWTLLPLILLLFFSSSYWYVRSEEKSYVEHQRNIRTKEKMNVTQLITQNLVNHSKEKASISPSQSSSYENEKNTTNKILDETRANKPLIDKPLTESKSLNLTLPEEKKLAQASEKQSDKSKSMIQSFKSLKGKKTIIKNPTTEVEKSTEKLGDLSTNESNKGKLAGATKYPVGSSSAESEKPKVAVQLSSENEGVAAKEHPLKVEKLQKNKLHQEQLVINGLKHSAVSSIQPIKADKLNENLPSQFTSSTAINESPAAELTAGALPESEKPIEKWSTGNIDNLSLKKAKFENSLNFGPIKVSEWLSNSLNGQQNNRKYPSVFRKGFSVRFTYSPDLSTIASNSFLKVGSNVGLLVEYRFSNRWSVQTGVIKSLKLYEALGSQYEVPVSWQQPLDPTSIDATCKMLDIPLNIRYDFTRNANSRWFVSSGFTSYVMLNEAYKYNYPPHNSDPSIHYSWNGNSGNYILSNLNLSIGYERQFLRKLSWQVEPFAHMPLSQVGFGKVRLITIGAFISVKYSFHH